MAEKAEIVKMLTVLAAAFPSAKITEQTYELYADLLKDLDRNLLAAAIRQCAAECEFYPTVRAIREKCHELRRLANSDGAPDAHTAWAEVRNNARYSSSDFSHQRIAEAARAIGGMKMLGMATDSDMVAHRARFLEAYEAMANREQQDAALLPAVRAAVARLQMQKQRPALEANHEG